MAAMLLLLLACATDEPAWDASDAPAELVVAHLEGGEVLRFGSDGSWLGEVLGAEAAAAIEATTDRPFAPSAVLPQDDGGAWVTDFTTGVVVAVDAEGAFDGLVREVGTGAGRVEEPCALLRHGERVLVLANDSGNVVDVEDADDALLGIPVPLRSPHGLALRGEQAWIGRSPTQVGAGLVERYDLVSGEKLAELVPYPDVEEATAVRFDGERLLVADFFRGRVTAWDPDSGDFLGEVVSGLAGPIDVEVDGEGAVWVLDREGVVRMGALGGEAERLVEGEAYGLGWTRDLVLR